jgi:hypothetical protein
VTWPEEGWPNWCKRRIEDSTFVLVACTETYLRRYNGSEETGTGQGVKWEGFVITQSLYESEGKNKKFIPILFVREDNQFIPIELRAYPRYLPTQDEGYDELLRTLTGQPERTPGVVAAAVRRLPTREGKREDKTASLSTAMSPHAATLHDPAQKVTDVHVKFTLNTPDGRRRVSFELERLVESEDIHWVIGFQLFERAQKTDSFGDAMVDLLVEVDTDLNDKAEKAAHDGMSEEQARHALGPAADTAKDAKEGSVTVEEAKDSIQDTLRQ